MTNLLISFGSELQCLDPKCHLLSVRLKPGNPFLKNIELGFQMGSIV